MLGAVFIAGFLPGEVPGVLAGVPLGVGEGRSACSGWPALGAGTLGSFDAASVSGVRALELALGASIEAEFSSREAESLLLRFGASVGVAGCTAVVT